MDMRIKLMGHMEVGMVDGYDKVRDRRFLDTPDRRGNEHRYYSNSDSDKNHDRHHYHPCRRNDIGYF